MRSTDLDHERWDLISWISVGELCKALTYRQFDPNLTTLSHVGKAIDAIGKVLSGTSEPREVLAIGWAHLAAAIQQRDLPANEYNAWIMRLDSDGGYENCPYHALKFMAETCYEGSIKYGEHNWLHGFPITGLLNHALSHLIKWCNGDRTENHLGHTMWAFMASVHMLIYRPDMCLGLLGPDYTLTDAIKSKLSEHAAHCLKPKLTATEQKTVAKNRRRQKKVVAIGPRDVMPVAGQRISDIRGDATTSQRITDGTN